jgi:hypothetical protein
MDQFSAHTTNPVLSIAAELTIEIIWIPEGAAEIYQPLDRRVFGALKSKGCAKWRRFLPENSGRPCNRETAAWLPLESWDDILRFQIPVDDPIRMELAKGDGDLRDVEPHLVERDRTAHRHLVRQIAARDILAANVQLLLRNERAMALHNEQVRDPLEH